VRRRGANGFGWRLRRTRDTARITQEVLADRADLSRPWLARIEGGHAEPRVSDALALFDVLATELPGLSLEWLLTGRGPERDTVGDDVKRRAFARWLATGMMLGPATLPMALDLERLSSGSRVDDEVLDGWTSLTETFARLRPLEPPANVLPMLETYLLTLRGHVARRDASGAAWRRLLSITAGTAALAGWVSFNDERRRGALGHLELADALAREADDGDALILVLMLRADLQSAVLTGGTAGFPELALRHLDEALERASGSTHFALRAPVLLRSAEEHAYAGLATASERLLDEAGRVVAAARDRHHYLRPQWGQRAQDVDRVLVAFRGNCLQMLGRTEEAIDELSTAETRFPGDRPTILTNLASAHAQRGDLDRACQLLLAAADVAVEHGAPAATRRIVGVRHRHLARWNGEPALGALDERLSLIP
jgi:transcriptional regulator with XRE-family HTH domain